jgi:hypothetical protein
MPEQAPVQQHPVPFLDRQPSKSVAPDWLLNHENRFDPNTYTPEDMIKKGYNTLNPEPVKRA